MTSTLVFVERPTCPVCGSGRTLDRYAEPFADGAVWAFLEQYYDGRIAQGGLGDARFVIAGCEDCGTHFQRFVLNDPGMAYLYETAISPEASLRKREDAGSRFFRGLIHEAGHVARLIPSERPREVRVLDFGMGWGHWAAAAKALGYDAYGAEISPRRIAFAASLGVPTVDPSSQAERSFDYIHADQVFEHLADPIAAMGELVRLLRPGGVLKVSVPDGRTVAGKLAAGWRPGKDELHPLEHLNAFTPSSLDGLAGRYGLRSIPRPWPSRLKRWATRTVTPPGGWYRKPA